MCGIVITDQEYPDMTAKGLVHKITGEFTSKYPRSAFNPITKESVRENPNPLPLPELKNYLTKYQDPQQADSIVKIQKELDETKTVVYKSIESILERGEKIDNLVAKSGDLSAQSKMFYTQVRISPENKYKLSRAVLTGVVSRPRSRTRVVLSCECA